METIFPQETGEVKDFLDHRCAQVFVSMKLKYIFFVLLHREVEAPGALQDFSSILEHHQGSTMID